MYYQSHLAVDNSSLENILRVIGLQKNALLTVEIISLFSLRNLPLMQFHEAEGGIF